MAAATQKVWLIVGCSSGFGLEIAKLALDRGDRVIATSRSASKLADLQAQGVETVSLDVTHSEEQIKKVVAEAVAKVGGRLDILVNNAGYVLLGGVDECSYEETLAQFDTNVFGMIKILAGVLPIMRKQGSGVIGNVGSIGGWKGSPIAGMYCATKYAVAGLTEAVREENASFGIETTVIEPGYFRTDLLSDGHVVTAKRQVEDLKPLSDKMKDMFASVNGHQPGDPKKGSAIMVEALSKSGPWSGKPLPLRLVLGADAQPYVRDTIQKSLADLDQWHDHTSQTNCDDVKS